MSASMSESTLGPVILGKQLLDLLSSEDSNVATFGNTSNNLILRIYDSNLPYGPKNYALGLNKNNQTHTTLYLSANTATNTRIGIGTTIANTVMEVTGTDALLIPKGDIGQRPDPTVTKKGHIRYNTELDLFEGYGTGEAWVSFGGVKNRDQSTKIEAELVPGALDNNLRFITNNNEAMRIVESGNIGIGTTMAKVRLEINSTDAMLIPQGTTSQRPSASEKGYVRYNTTTSQFEGFGAGNTWGSLGGVKSTDQTTYISAELAAGTNDSNLRFYTGDAQHMIITRAGNIGMGTTSPVTNVHMIGDLTVSGSIRAGDYLNLFASQDTFDRITMDDIDPTTRTRAITTNDPNPQNRILYSFTSKGGRFFVNASIPYKNLSSLIAINTVSWANIGIYKTSAAAFTNTTPAVHLSPMSIHTDETETMTHSFNSFVEHIDISEYVVAISGKGHVLEFGGTTSDHNLYIIPMKSLGYNETYTTRTAIQLSPFRFTEMLDTQAVSTFQHDMTGNFMVTGSNIDVYINGVKKRPVYPYTYPVPPEYDFTYSYSYNQPANTTSLSINLRTAISSAFYEAVIWPTAVSEEVYASGYFYQNAAWMGNLIVDRDVNNPLRGNIGIGTAPQDPYALAIKGLATISGNLGVGTTPAAFMLNVEGNGRFAQNVGIGTTPAAFMLHVNGSGRFAQNVGIGTAIAGSHMLHVNGGTFRVSTPTSTATAIHTAEFINTTHNATTPQLRLEATGNVGVGTATALGKLHVIGDVFSSSYATIGNRISQPTLGATLYNAVYQWGAAGTPPTNIPTNAFYRDPTSYEATVIRQDNSQLGLYGFKPALILYNGNGTNNTTVGLEFASLDATSGATNTSSALAGIICHKVGNTVGNMSTGTMTFFTKNNVTRSDAIHIIENGNVGIGTSSVNYKLRIEGLTGINNDLIVSGDITGFGSVSDQRLKTDVTSIPIDKSLDNILRLRPVTFKWNEKVFNPNKQGCPDVGLIAQEVRAVIPLVTENINFPSQPTEFLGIQYPKLIPYLIGAVQELSHQIQVLTHRVSDLESKSI